MTPFEFLNGIDLSGSLQSAGGIGGMLAMSRPSAANTQNYYYHADGNGNITALVNAQQIIVATYLFDPFGNTLSISGPLAAINLYRFSSKESHANTDLIYYLHRFYDSMIQRWLNRDPAGEQGSECLFSFVSNNPIDYIDSEGQQELSPSTIPVPPAGSVFRPIILPPYVPPATFDPVPPPIVLPPQYPVGRGPQPVPAVSAPNSDSEPSLDQFPPIPQDWTKAPTKCKPNCPPERLAELNRRVDQACANTPKCSEGFLGIGGDTYSQLRQKMSDIGRCLNARIRRERECFGGGDQGHVQQIDQLTTQLNNCRRIWNEKRMYDRTQGLY